MQRLLKGKLVEIQPLLDLVPDKTVVIYRRVSHLLHYMPRCWLVFNLLSAYDCYFLFYACRVRSVSHF